MIVPVNQQKLYRRPPKVGGYQSVKRWESPSLDRIKIHLKAFENSIEEFLQSSPILNFPFYAAIPLFIVVMGFLSPHLGWDRSALLQFREFSLPEDNRLDRLLLNLDNLDATLESGGVESENDSSQQVPLALPFKELEITPYTVQPGDSLSVIANRYGISLSTLINYNNIQNVRRLQVGMDLKIPNQDGMTYTVKKGDSLSLIAKSSKVGYEEILDLNNLESPVIVPGQVLFLPGAAMSSFELKSALGELFIYPARGKFTSSYGWRNDPFTGVRRFHNGVDIANAPGTPIMASMDGKVGDVGFHSSYGNYIVLNHDGGYQTMYAHLRSFSVKRGEGVNQGQKIGEMGSTGYSTGSHVHFSVFKRNQHIDPLKVLH